MTKTPAEAAPTYEDDVKFSLRVSRPVWVGPFKYLPRDEVEVDGKFINDLIQENGPDVVRTVRPV